MRKIILKFLVLLLLILYPSLGYAINIDLECKRDALRSDMTGVVLDERGNAIAGTFSKTPYQNTIRVKIRGKSGFVNDSDGVGLLNSKQGQIHTVNVTDSTIKATYYYSFLTDRSIIIDRYTGIMKRKSKTIGTDTFKCVAIDTTKKLF